MAGIVTKDLPIGTGVNNSEFPIIARYPYVDLSIRVFFIDMPGLGAKSKSNGEFVIQNDVSPIIETVKTIGRMFHREGAAIGTDLSNSYVENLKSSLKIECSIIVCNNSSSSSDDASMYSHLMYLKNHVYTGNTFTKADFVSYTCEKEDDIAKFMEPLKSKN